MINMRVSCTQRNSRRYRLRAVRSLQHQVGQSRHFAISPILGNASVRPELIRQQAAVDDSLGRLLASIKNWVPC
jgi:hypothetical protein